MGQDKKSDGSGGHHCLVCRLLLVQDEALEDRLPWASFLPSFSLLPQWA